MMDFIHEHFDRFFLFFVLMLLLGLYMWRPNQSTETWVANIIGAVLLMLKGAAPKNGDK